MQATPASWLFRSTAALSPGASGNTCNAGTLWQSPKYTKETATGDETSWNFPSGYPASLSG
jgi:hypothetical protein